MLSLSKATALGAGLVAALAAASLAQNPPAGNRPAGSSSNTETVVVSEAQIDWIEKSDVAALREGVIEKMELQIGAEVARDGVIGLLHREIAELTVAKAQVAATNVAAKEKAQAQKDLALAVLARSLRLDRLQKNAVAREEIQKNEAEVKVAEALLKEAVENQKLAEAELALAKRALEEHTIIAPFDGVITERMKNPGESVRANEPVVRMGKIDKLRIQAWVPIEDSFRVKVGMPVEVTPNVPGADLPIERKKFRGKITFVDPEAQPVKTEVRVFAEVLNDEEHNLRPGLKADMIIFLNGNKEPAPPAVGARASTQPR